MGFHVVFGSKWGMANNMVNVTMNNDDLTIKIH